MFAIKLRSFRARVISQAGADVCMKNAVSSGFLGICLFVSNIIAHKLQKEKQFKYREINNNKCNRRIYNGELIPQGTTSS